MMEGRGHLHYVIERATVSGTGLAVSASGILTYTPLHLPQALGNRPLSCMATVTTIVVSCTLFLPSTLYESTISNVDHRIDDDDTMYVVYGGTNVSIAQLSA